MTQARLLPVRSLVGQVRLPGERRIRARERAEDPDVDGELWATVQDLAGA